MSYKKWVVGSPDKNFAKEIAEELDIDPFTALIASSRGVDNLTDFEYFISDEPIIFSPFVMADIKKGADCVNEAIGQGLKIAVFGDYDCDGVMATAIMFKYLKSRGADVITYIPDRITEGYGMNKDAVLSLSKQGVNLIITVDNGIASKEEIDYASSLGIVTVVTDHHLPSGSLPDAAAVIDPHRNDCKSEFKEICGAQVAFCLVCAIENKEPEEMLYEYGDLLSVAIIGDFMPMLGENRSIVKYGIERIKNNSNVGISAILSVAGIDKETLDSGKISFGIVPRINAAGRMGSAKRALTLVTDDNVNTVLSIANEIEQDNQFRQKTEKEILKDALIKIEKNGLNHDRIIVVCGENYHHGVVGIVAARICDTYGRPAIVLSSDGDIAHGSGRSIKGTNIFEAINSSSKHLVKFGGHELAAGITIETKNIEDFRKSINDYAFSVKTAVPTLNIDCRINPAALSLEMVDAVKALEPFGNGNTVPILGIFDAKLQRITPLGHGKHLKLLFSKGNVFFQGMLFGTTPDNFYQKIGDIVDIAITIDKNTYKNEENISVTIKAIRPSGIDDDKLFCDIFAVDDFLSRNIIKKNIILPSREEIGAVYNYIKKNETTKNDIINSFLTTIGFAKTCISIRALSELKLVTKAGNKIIIAETQKTDLSNSNTLMTINKG